MTEIAFHFNVPDKLAYGCRLLRKAHASGAQVVVTGESAQLSQLDELLWTFSATDFLPHTRLVDQQPGERDGAENNMGMLLTEWPGAVQSQGVLVNLGQKIPDSFERFNRFIELVTGEPEDRLAARRRWKHYADRGYALTSHDQADVPAQP